jgi:hypothetical protein
MLEHLEAFRITDQVAEMSGQAAVVTGDTCSNSRLSGFQHYVGMLIAFTSFATTKWPEATCLWN